MGEYCSSVAVTPDVMVYPSQPCVYPFLSLCTVRYIPAHTFVYNNFPGIR